MVSRFSDRKTGKYRVSRQSKNQVFNQILKNWVFRAKNCIFRSKYWVSRQSKNQPGLSTKFEKLGFLTENLVFRRQTRLIEKSVFFGDKPSFSMEIQVFRRETRFFDWKTWFLGNTGFLANRKTRFINHIWKNWFFRPKKLSRNLVFLLKTQFFNRKTQFLPKEPGFWRQTLFYGKNPSVLSRDPVFRSKNWWNTGFRANRKTRFINQIWKTAFFTENLVFRRQTRFIKKPGFSSINPVFRWKTKFFVEKPGFSIENPVSRFFDRKTGKYRVSRQSKNQVYQQKLKKWVFSTEKW